MQVLQSAIRKPRSVSEATKLCERFAQLDGQRATIEEERQRLLSKVNADADVEAQPVLEELAAIKAKLEDWWPANAEALTEGKRKSIELGGCKIGSRAGKESLGCEGDEKAVVSALMSKRWAKPLLNFSVSLKRAAVLMSLDGGHKQDLARLGLHKVDAPETFVLERTAQGGTLAGAKP